MTNPTPEPQSDIEFLRSLAKRLSTALYHATTKPVGTNGLVSPGLLHDDYDRLRALAKRMEIESLEAKLVALRESKP